MAAIIYTEQALADLDRLTDFLLQEQPAAALETAQLIIEAVEELGPQEPCERGKAVLRQIFRPFEANSCSI